MEIKTKKIAMNTQLPKQEILLVVTRTLAQNEFAIKMESGNTDRQNNLLDALELACWNGLLPEILPGVINMGKLSDPFYIWQIDNRKTFLKISLGPCFVCMDLSRSIDPESIRGNIILN